MLLWSTDSVTTRQMRLLDGLDRGGQAQIMREERRRLLVGAIHNRLRGGGGCNAMGGNIDAR